MKNFYEYIFWAVMAMFAIFYLTIGNDMHKQKYENIEKRIEEKFSNK